MQRALRCVLFMAGCMVYGAAGYKPSRLAKITDLQVLTELVGDLIWNSKDVHCKDTSGKGGGRTYVISKPGGQPEACVLKIKSLQSLAPISSERIEVAESLLGMPPIAAGDDWTILPFAGTSVAKGASAPSQYQFDHSLASLDSLARLMAKIHAVPTQWYASIRQKTISRDPRLSTLLADAPLYSHVWQPFGLGLENGMVFLGGGFPNAGNAKDIMERQIASGSFQKLIAMKSFYPVSELGKRIVTVHGDFKGDNILLSDSNDLNVIDFEMTSVGSAARELGYCLVMWLGPQWGLTFEERFGFFEAYVVAVTGEPTTRAAVYGLMLDAEIETITCFVGLLSNVWDGQVPLLRGAPHPTAKAYCDTSDNPPALELLDLLGGVVKEVRCSHELSEYIIKNGFVLSMYQRKVGSEPLWECLEDWREKNMLFLFGLLRA